MLRGTSGPLLGSMSSCRVFYKSRGFSRLCLALGFCLRLAKAPNQKQRAMCQVEVHKPSDKTNCPSSRRRFAIRKTICLGDKSFPWLTAGPLEDVPETKPIWGIRQKKGSDSDPGNTQFSGTL